MMRLTEKLVGVKAVVFGLGASGKAATEVLTSFGAKVFAVDHSRSSAVAEGVKPLLGMGAEVFLGAIPDRVMTDAELVVVSPGVPTDLSEIETARASGAKIIGELELSYLLCDAQFLAVTGTKGKSTTARLLASILKAAGMQVVLGGNLPGEPLSPKVLGLSSKAKVVAEVSSFQLETIDRFRPYVSCITNLDVDHLDRYDGLSDYYSAKLRIFENQDESEYLVLNEDDPKLMDYTRDARPHSVLFSVEDDSLTDGVFLSKNAIEFREEGKVLGSSDRAEVHLPGVHNLKNVMAASAMAMCLDVPPQAVRDALARFRLAPHTLEVFAELEGITFVDDSHATNPLSVSVAIQAFDKPIVLIAGGKDKGGDFKRLIPPARDRVKLVIAIGEAAERIESELSSDLPVVVNRGGIEDVVNMAIDRAEAHEVVLLSPGCSSFDMFVDFRDRGRRFKRAVFAAFEKEKAKSHATR